MKEIERVETMLREHGHSAKDIAVVGRAFQYASSIHQGVLRVSGKPYIVHPIAVAHHLAAMRMPPRIVAAGLLHDVIEDTTLPQDEVRKELRLKFGDDIAELVERVTKLRFTKQVNTSAREAGINRYIENLRRSFIAFASDLRAIIVKFADRIENLKDIEVLPEEKKRRVALETLEVYAPIANRLGMANFRVELEDLAFRHAFPAEYQRVVDLVGQKYASREGYLDRIGELATQKLNAAGIQSIVSMQARTKHLFSLYKKLLKYDWDVNRIWDIFALRIIAQNVPDCYAALGVIHSLWKPVKGRIKDYISQPKPNGYRSLHTTVFCDDGEFVEFQIRTTEMHEEAQFGVAAHWRYDENFKGNKALPAKDIDWVQELAKIQKEIESNARFLETLEQLKIDAFKNRIFCFTPKGDVIELPEDGTPVDFAYAIHTDVGNTTTAAIVNEKNVSLDTPLQSGDMVKIITDKNRKGPSADWLKFVKTRLARERIKTHAKSSLADFLNFFVPRAKKK